MQKIQGARSVAPTVEAFKRLSGEEIAVHGTVYKIRRMSGFAFVLLKICGRLLQCVYSPEFADFDLSELRENMCVRVRGRVAAEERSGKGVELRLLSFEALSAPSEPPPVVVNGKGLSASLETLLDFRPLTLRNVRETAVFRIQSKLCEGMRSFLLRASFTEVHTPKLVSSGAEGGANLFRLDYFGREACLAQSPQLYKQMLVGVFERVFEIGPVFRAEKHDTARHLNEYTSVDAELGFIDSFNDLMRLETQLLAETMAFVSESCAEELSLLGLSLPACEEIPALPFAEAKAIVAKARGRQSGDSGDFEPEEERLLCELIQRETGSEFVFVTHYPSSKRPFYAMDSRDNPAVTESFDLLFRGMEITTGGQRIHDYREQAAKLRAHGLDERAFSGYLSAHRCGLPPHGGFGLGLERLTARLCGFDNVRRAALFPRDTRRLEP